MAHKQHNFFDTVVPKCRAALPKDGEIPSAEFCDAADAVLKIFDTLRLGTLQSDLIDNAMRVRKKMAEFENRTIQGMCEAEIALVGGKAKKILKKDGTMCGSLLWLKRGLDMIAALLTCLTTPDSLSECVFTAYNYSLRMHHSRFTKVAASACAGRSLAFAPRPARRAVALTPRAILAARCSWKPRSNRAPIAWFSSRRLRVGRAAPMRWCVVARGYPRRRHVAPRVTGSALLIRGRWIRGSKIWCRSSKRSPEACRPT